MTPSATHYAVAATVTRADIPVLCADLAERLRGRDSGVVVCDVGGVAEPDVVTVEALARLRLTARRHGWTLVVRGADRRLLDLVNLLGLGDALTPSDALAPSEVISAEVGGQAEQREQVGRVEEVVDGRDPPA